jgi:hypothetical protein
VQATCRHVADLDHSQTVQVKYGSKTGGGPYGHGPQFLCQFHSMFVCLAMSTDDVSLITMSVIQHSQIVVSVLAIDSLVPRPPGARNFALIMWS